MPATMHANSKTYARKKTVSRSRKARFFYLKMHENPFGGRAPPGLAGGLYNTLLQYLGVEKGRDRSGGEGRGKEGISMKGGKGREGKGEGFHNGISFFQLPAVVMPQ